MRLPPAMVLGSSLLAFLVFLPGTLPRRTPPSPLAKGLPGLPTRGTQSEAVWVALITGESRGLSPSTKKAYYSLGLGHFFSPSGVHLSAINPLVRWIPYGRALYLPLGLLALLTPGLLALSRVAWVKTVGQRCWLPTLLAEGALHSWRHSPLSWTCSWLFLGLGACRARPLFAWFLAGQLLLCWVFGQPFSWLAPLAALSVGLPLALLFPALLAASLLPWAPPHDWLLATLRGLHQAVLYMDGLHHQLPPLSPHAGHLCWSVAILALKGKAKILGTATLTLLLSSPIGPAAAPPYSPTAWYVPAPRARLASAAQKGKSSRSAWDDGTKCRHILRDGDWVENCRAPKKARQAGFRKLSFQR